MTPGDLIWLFFVFSALQPMLKQQYREATRRRLIAKIERERKSRVILLVHRQETMSVRGFPVFRYIDVNDSQEVLRAGPPAVGGNLDARLPDHVRNGQGLRSAGPQ